MTRPFPKARRAKTTTPSSSPTSSAVKPIDSYHRTVAATSSTWIIGVTVRVMRRAGPGAAAAGGPAARVHPTRPLRLIPSANVLVLAIRDLIHIVTPPVSPLQHRSAKDVHDMNMRRATYGSKHLRTRRLAAALGLCAIAAARTGFSRPATAPSPPETESAAAPLAVPPDSPRWELEGEAKPADYLGRKCLLLDGGGATLKDFEMRDGVVDVDVATPAKRGFFGIQFRLADDDGDGEWVYLRQHKSGLPDAMQYSPILKTGLNWQIYNGPGFTGAVDIPRDSWFHLRLEVTGAQARLFVKDMEKPALVMDDLKSGVQKGQLALAALTARPTSRTSRSGRPPTRPGSGTSRRCRRGR